MKEVKHILEAKAALDSMIEEVKTSYFTDKNIPLDERWELYKQLSALLPIHSWVSNNAIEETLDDISLYDDLGFERRQTVKYADFVENQEDDLFWYKDHPEYDADSPRFTEETLNTLKEHVLTSGQQGFNFDW